ncbi:GntR family transcriptional regulator YhfZ [Georgenia sp. Z1491]|uniref:GntR family transcriptional regulator YhfZ n=1 Tax=Georgenia sp. Z1491 TaxID=3416707 RepID=UPI003CEE370F
MTRVGYVVSRLAGELAALTPGDRIPKVDDLAEKLDCGRGTIQAAFAVLEEAAALRLKARGRLGTFVEAIDHRNLWELSGRRSASLAMPLPYTRRYEGLATGLQAAFDDGAMPLTLSFIRGSVARVRALREGRVDLALVSALAASTFGDVETVHDYGPGSYVAAHAVVVRRGMDPTDATLRVAVDPSSADLVDLVARVFPDLPAERRIEMSYNHLDRAFTDGAVDATVWNADEIGSHISTPIDLHPLPDSVGDANTRGVVLRLAGDTPISVAVLDALRSDRVLGIADDVVAGRAIPTY